MMACLSKKSYNNKILIFFLYVYSYLFRDHYVAIVVYTVEIITYFDPYISVSLSITLLHRITRRIVSCVSFFNTLSLFVSFCNIILTLHYLEMFLW